MAIPVRPDEPGGSNDSPPNNSSNNSSNNNNGSGTKKKGSGNPYLAAQRKAQRKAANRYLDQAEVLNSQIAALRRMLGPKGFRHALDIQLANVGRTLRQEDKIARGVYKERVASLENAVADNEAAASDQTEAAATNRTRERTSALSEAMLQGSGETDLLRAQQMSLRTWDANQSEVERSRADTLSSINAGLTDLNADTRTARANMVVEANSDREQLWTNYFGRRAETFTNLYNTLGLQAEYYGMANEQVGSKKTRKLHDATTAAAERAARRSAKETGKAWRNPGIPRHLREWEGREEFTTVNNAAKYENAPANVSLDRPEGATLRSWTA